MAAIGMLLTMVAASSFSQAHGFRVAFIADTGIGNSKPGSVWVDYRGVTRRPSYLVDGVECENYKGEYCGAFSRARDVFQLARDASVDLVISAGDQDYESSPVSWFRFLTEEAFRPGLGYLATKGNHDVDGWDGVKDLWSGPKGYQKLLERQIPRGAKCYGAYGEDFACDYKGVLFVLSSVGCEAPGESANKAHYEFLEKSLSESDAKWKVCVWHMTMEKLQTSYKGDSTGFGAYEICRKYGAFIVTGHAHTYSRSFEMSSFGTKVYGFTRENLQVSSYDASTINLTPGDKGTTGLAVVGIGGYKNEAQLTDSGIWAKMYSSQCARRDSSCEQANDANKFGALICEFDASSDKAPCWLATTARLGATEVERRARERVKVDEFTLIRRQGTKPSSSSAPSTSPSKTTTRETPLKTDPSILTANDDAHDDDDGCFDVPPTPDTSCADQANWGKCDREYMRGFCLKSCNRCAKKVSL
jgi:hypothetical protein